MKRMLTFSTLRLSLTTIISFLFFMTNVSGQEAIPLPAKPIQKLEFMGWDYNKIGYTLNPGENAELLFQNNTTADMTVPVSWVLKTYEQDSLTSGLTNLTMKSGAIGRVPIQLPAGMKDGPYMVYYSPQAEGWQGPNPFYFDYRKPLSAEVPHLNVVALIENMDTEGWVRMMLGPVAGYVNVMNDFPDNKRSVDAAIVVAEAMDYYSPKFAALQDYVMQGGTLIVFGKTAPVLTKLLPVKGADQTPGKSKPLALKPLADGPWQGFQPTADFLHYSQKVKANSGTKILAEWSDGTPAVVSGSYKLGKVIYVGTGTYQVWQKNKAFEGADELVLRLLYDAKGGAAAVNSMLKLAADIQTKKSNDAMALKNRVLEGQKINQPENFVPISKNNLGRFGWLTSEGGLTENLGSNGRVSTVGTQDWAMRGGSMMRSDEIFTFSLVIGNDQSPVAKEVDQNWFAKSIEWNYKNGEKVISILSLGSPSICWEGKSKNISISGSKITHIAFMSAKGIKTYAAGEKIDPKEMKENWLLTFTADAAVRDMPQLVVFTKKPVLITFEKGLNLSFAENGFEAIFTSRLYGIKRLAPGATLPWLKSIPEGIVADASRWSRSVIDFPVDCDEIGWIEGDMVKIASRYNYKSFTTDWKTKPVRLAPIPPVYDLAKKVGAPVQLPAGLIDLKCPTKYGMLKAVAGSSTLIGISLPPTDHRAIVPANGRMVLDDIINRNVTGLDLNSVYYADQNTRNEGSGRFNADLFPYDYSRVVPYTQAPQIDVYKWWYAFNAVLARPTLGDSIRREFDRHNTTRYWETFNFYPHKSLVVQKREPYTLNEYMITFVWPTQSQYGFRNFNDINEASGVNVYCYTSYARYYGDWTTLKANWNLCRELHDYLVRTQDWACLSSGALESWGVAGLDMLNSEAYGSLTFGYAAENAGYPEDALKGKVMGTRSLIPTVARLGLQDYLAEISAPGDPWLEFVGFEHFNEMGMQLGKRKFGSVGWLDTSKGAMHELSLGYKMWATKGMTAEQKALEKSGSNSSCDLTQRLLLGWNRDSLVNTTRESTNSPRSRQLSWQSATYLYDMAILCVGDIPVFLSDWTPAEYISGTYNIEKKQMQLAFQSAEADPFTVRIYSRYQPLNLKVNDASFSGWKYDSKTGWLTIDLQGGDRKNLQIVFGNEVAPLHPYLVKK